ncbi:MAG: hypothetical protein H6839_07015 [Planctomycetes bacterium]|nr:hypothetical protein [Planctomycetota bacterium]
MPEERRIHEAEVVRKGESQNETERHVVQRVDVRRIPGGAFIGRSLFEFHGDPKAARKRLSDLKFKLWLWLIGFALISAACVYGAFTTETVIFSAFLLLTAVACAVAVSFVWIVIWAVRRVPLP